MLFIAELDWLIRSFAGWQTMIERCFGEAVGEQLFSVADSIDLRTAADGHALNVLLSFGQRQRESIGERIGTYLWHRISKGERFGKICYAKR